MTQLAPIPLDHFGEIVAHTPRYVWGLLAVLVYFGSKQLFGSRPGLRRVTVMPLAMTALSIYGTASAFGASATVAAAWLAGWVVAFALVLQLPTPVRLAYDPASRRFNVPGSAVPLALMMSIFALKYAVGIELVMQPGMRLDADFAMAVAGAYGVFSGIFAARAWRMLRLALRHEADLDAAARAAA